MSETRPVYLHSPVGADSLLSGLVPDREVITLARAGELKDRTPGLLLLPIELLPADQVFAALAITGAAPSESPWMPVLVERSADDKTCTRPVSLGWPTPLAEVAGWKRSRSSFAACGTWW